MAGCRRSVFVFLSVLIVALIMVHKLTYQAPDVNVYIIEEHHEALQYWYKTAMEKTIGRTGNVLVHIDAHSDFADPVFTEDYPDFTWPRNKKELRAMMQKNDVFIKGAAYIGLIDHFIWIFPYWDSDHTPNGYEHNEYVLGYTTQNGEEYFCECVEEDGHEICTYTNDDGVDSEEDIEIDRRKCRRKRTLTVDMVADHVALDMLKKGILLPRHKPLILDIDEDFFGCASGFSELNETGIPEAFIIDMNVNIVSKLLCPKTTRQETLADVLMKEYIKEYVRQCDLNQDSETCLNKHVDFGAHFQTYISTVWRKHRDIFCSSRHTKILKYSTKLLRKLDKLTLKNINSLLQVGFCMGTSPAVSDFREDGDFSVCHGYNLPNETIVPLWTPSKAELWNSTAKFRAMLQYIVEYQPSLVTVCRSVRDGYTPRRLANHIEDNIVGFLKSPAVTQYANFVLNYDLNLLGGREGWAGRYMYHQVL